MIFLFLFNMKQRHIGSTQDLQLNLTNSQLRSWAPLGLITFLKKNYFLLNNIIMKIDTHKIKQQLNTMMFVWD